jgi:hypothetical protein
MPQINIDFGAKEQYEIIPQGEYRVQVTDTETKESKSGKPMLGLTFEIVEGDYENRKLFSNLMLDDPKALWRTRRDLGVLLGTSDLEGQFDFNTEDLIGAEAIAKVTHRVWKESDGGDGEARPNVQKLEPVGF